MNEKIAFELIAAVLILYGVVSKRLESAIIYSLCPVITLQPPHECSYQGICTEPVSNDTHQNSADHGHGDGVATGQIFLEHNHGENDTGQTPGSEPAHEQLFICTQFDAGERQEDRYHPDQGKTEHCVEYHLPAE